MDTTQLIKIVASLLVGGVMPFVAEYLNRVWKLDGAKALSLAGVLSAVLTVAAVALVGWLTGTLQTTFAPTNLLPLFLLVYGVGQTVFALVKDSLGWTSATAKGTPVETTNPPAVG